MQPKVPDSKAPDQHHDGGVAFTRDPLVTDGDCGQLAHGRRQAFIFSMSSVADEHLHSRSRLRAATGRVCRAVRQQEHPRPLGK